MLHKGNTGVQMIARSFGFSNSNYLSIHYIPRYLRS